MVVWKEHTMNVPEPDEYVMEVFLMETANMVYEGKSYFIDRVQNEIFDHLHWHARKKIENNEKKA